MRYDCKYRFAEESKGDARTRASVYDRIPSDTTNVFGIHYHCMRRATKSPIVPSSEPKYRMAAHNMKELIFPLRWLACLLDE